MDLVALAILEQGIFEDFSDHSAGAIGHQHDLVGEGHGFGHIVGDRQQGLAEALK